ncbi:MAG: hypothetical protein WCO84_07465, partial [bacterium]
HFTQTTTLSDWLLLLQRLVFILALIWLVVVAVQKKEWKSATWILVLWLVVPVAVFTGAGLWTYLTYFAILFPAHFLIFGAVAQRLKPVTALSLAGLLAVGNVVFMLDYYRFVERNGGAQGSAGTAMENKLTAAKFLAKRGGMQLLDECAAQLAGKPNVRSPLLVELNNEGRGELPQLEWPLLITQAGAGSGAATSETIFIVDGNREALPSAVWQQLGQLPGTNFGPIKLYFVKR